MPHCLSSSAQGNWQERHCSTLRIARIHTLLFLWNLPRRYTWAIKSVIQSLSACFCLERSSSCSCARSVHSKIYNLYDSFDNDDTFREEHMFQDKGHALESYYDRESKANFWRSVVNDKVEEILYHIFHGSCFAFYFPWNTPRCSTGKSRVLP